MSTPNFYNQKNFKLYVQSFEPMSLEEYKNEYFEEDDYLFPEYQNAQTDSLKEYILEKSYNSNMEMQSYFFYEDIINGYDGFKGLMEDFTDTLVFHKLDFKSGYYTGMQIYVEETENPHELDNEDCNYYFDMCRSKAIRKYDAEIRKINRWLDKVAVEYGWRELYCVGIFSNGEAVYKYADMLTPIQKAVYGGN